MFGFGNEVREEPLPDLTLFSDEAQCRRVKERADDRREKCPSRQKSAETSESRRRGSCALGVISDAVMGTGSVGERSSPYR